VGLIERIGKPGQAALLLAIGLAGGATALAVASVPGSNGQISACVQVTTTATTVGKPPITVPTPTTPNVRIIDTGAGQVCNTSGTVYPGYPTETGLNWSATGPQGLPGTPGTAGTPGSRGPEGTAVTIADGDTLTLPNREVITVGGALLTAPVVKKGRSLGTVTVKGLKQGSAKSGGQSTYSFEITGFQFGLQSPADTGTGSAKGKSQHGTVTITKEVDSASPSLLEALFRNEVLKQVRIVINEGGGGKSETIDLANAVVTLVGRPPTGAGESQVETLSFAFQKVTIAFTK